MLLRFENMWYWLNDLTEFSSTFVFGVFTLSNYIFLFCAEKANGTKGLIGHIKDKI